MSATVEPELATVKRPDAHAGRDWRRRLPNLLTTSRLLLAFVLFWAIGHAHWRMALVLFLIAVVTDWLVDPHGDK